MSSSNGARRKQRMLDGRRVTLADLVENDMLAVGAELVFHRPRLGETYRATVSERGRVRLEDGQEFASLSGAAAVCLDGVAGPDGWYAWRIGSADGPRLDEIRQRLLDQAAAEEPGDAAPAQHRHEFLRDARRQAELGTPVSLTVRDLIKWWGKRGRGTRISQQIDADLANHGLATSPSFRKVTLDASIEMVLAGVDENQPADEQQSEAVAAMPSGVDGSDDLDSGLTVGNLPSALGGIAHVAPTATFDEAITRMLLNDYSQLAVLAGSRTLRGAVTWRSIAKVRHTNDDACLADAIVPAREVRYDQELIDVLPALADEDFVIVRDQQNAIAGIVTTSDVVAIYGEMATPFLLLGQLDQHLRWLMQRYFSIDDVIRCCDSDGARGIEEFDDLSFGDYQRMLENPANWEQLGWPLDRSVFVRRLDEIREIRNDVMHFNPDPLPTDAVNMLRHFLKLLREYNP